MPQIKYILLIVLSLCLFSCTPGIEDMEGKTLTITGEIRLVGNAPFGKLAITGPNNKSILIQTKNREQKIDLHQKMGTSQTLTGILKIRKLTTGDGKITVRDYILES